MTQQRITWLVVLIYDTASHDVVIYIAVRLFCLYVDIGEYYNRSSIISQINFSLVRYLRGVASTFTPLCREIFDRFVYGRERAKDGTVIATFLGATSREERFFFKELPAEVYRNR